MEKENMCPMLMEDFLLVIELYKDKLACKDGKSLTLTFEEQRAIANFIYAHLRLD